MDFAKIVSRSSTDFFIFLKLLIIISLHIIYWGDMMYIINKVKKNILKLSLLISLIIILSFYHNTYKKNVKTIPSFGYNIQNNHEYDFDGDGENDELSIISTNSIYSIKIKNSFGDTLLKSNEFDYSFLIFPPIVP